jgi:hypothetical protein
MNLTFLLFVALALPAYAQTTVYRCGNAYSDKPCQDAKVIVIPSGQNSIAFSKVTPSKPTVPQTPAYSGGYFYDPGRFATGSGRYLPRFPSVSAHQVTTIAGGDQRCIASR